MLYLGLLSTTSYCFSCFQQHPIASVAVNNIQLLQLHSTISNCFSYIQQYPIASVAFNNIQLLQLQSTISYCFSCIQQYPIASVAFIHIWPILLGTIVPSVLLPVPAVSGAPTVTSLASVTVPASPGWVAVNPPVAVASGTYLGFVNTGAVQVISKIEQ